MLLPTDMLAPSTSTHSLLLTPMVLLFQLMSLLLLLPVLSTSPPRELPMLLPLLLPMLQLPQQSTPLPPMLAPLLESQPWLLTPMVLLSLLTSLQWLLPVLTTSSPRE